MVAPLCPILVERVVAPGRRSVGKCAVEACDREARTNGMCKNHAERLRIASLPFVACVLDGCAKDSRAGSRGMCPMHYGRTKRSGTPDDSALRRRPAGSKGTRPCRAENCDRMEHCGWTPYCSTHGPRVRNHGDPNFRANVPNEQKVAWLRDLTLAQPTGTCADWPWGVSARGRPDPVRVEGKYLTPTTAIMGMIAPRPSPRHGALHSCDRPVCCAPWHLRWGTAKENVEDMTERGRGRHQKVARLAEAIRRDPVAYASLLEMVDDLSAS